MIKQQQNRAAVHRSVHPQVKVLKLFAELSYNKVKVKKTTANQSSILELHYKQQPNTALGHCALNCTSKM